MALVKSWEGQKQEASELEVHFGTSESQVLRQDGNTCGQGAFDGMGVSEETEPGDTEVFAASVFVSVPMGGDEGVPAGGAGVRVVGGASVHLVQTVTVDVITVWLNVLEVVTKVLEPEVLVTVTGHRVVVVKTISVVMTSEGAGVDPGAAVVEFPGATTVDGADPEVRAGGVDVEDATVVDWLSVVG